MSTALPDGPLTVELLAPEHDVRSFRCAYRGPEEYLRRHALADQQANKARTYVAFREGRVGAYFTVACGVTERAPCCRAMGERKRRQLVPVVVLTRFAVDVSEQWEILGRTLLGEVLRRIGNAARVTDARAVVAAAVDPELRSLLVSVGFECLPGHSLHLYTLLDGPPADPGLRVDQPEDVWGILSVLSQPGHRKPRTGSRGGDMVSTGLMSEFG